MNITRRRLIMITAGCALAASPALAQAAVGARWRGIALGAEADLRIVGMPRRDGEHLLALARAEITRLEKQFSLYRSDSALVNLNTAGMLRDPSPDMLALMSLSDSIHRVSGGIFDPSIQPLWAAHAEHGGRPPAYVLEKVLAQTGWDNVSVTEDRIGLPVGGAITLNGIAQGYITDKVTALLKSEGLQTGVVEVGEISTVGAKPGGGAWPVLLKAPGERRPDTEITLEDMAVATSSVEGSMIGPTTHILDPRTGRTSIPRWQRVSIIHRSAAVADGLSTAGTLMNEAELRSLAADVKGVSVNAISTDGTTLTVGSCCAPRRI